MKPKPKNIIISVFPTNKPAISLYKKFGFVRVLNKKTILLLSEKYSFPTLEAISGKVIRFSNLKNFDKKLNKNGYLGEKIL